MRIQPRARDRILFSSARLWAGALGAAAIALSFLFIFAHDQSAPDPTSATRAGAEQDFADASDGDSLSGLSASALAIQFELRYAEIAEHIRRKTRAEIDRSGFAWLPGRSLQSVIEIECEPRLAALQRRAADYPQELIAAAVPAELRATEPPIECRRLVYESLCSERPALAPCDPALLHARLTAVDRLQFDYQARLANRKGHTESRAPAQALADFENYVAARRRLIGQAADEDLFAIQDDHNRLLYKYAAFRADPATGDLAVAERLNYYRKLATSFEDKHGVRLKDHDGERRDHVSRLLLLIDAPAQPDAQANAEEERFEIIKEFRGPDAARRDRDLRRASRAERAQLAAFEAERLRRIQAIDRRLQLEGGDRQARRAAIRAMESELSGKYFKSE